MLSQLQRLMHIKFTGYLRYSGKYDKKIERKNLDIEVCFVPLTEVIQCRSVGISERETSISGTHVPVMEVSLLFRSGITKFHCTWIHVKINNGNSIYRIS